MTVRSGCANRRACNSHRARAARKYAPARNCRARPPPPRLVLKSNPDRFDASPGGGEGSVIIASHASSEKRRWSRHFIEIRPAAELIARIRANYRRGLTDRIACTLSSRLYPCTWARSQQLRKTSAYRQSLLSIVFLRSFCVYRVFDDFRVTGRQSFSVICSMNCKWFYPRIWD